MKIFSTVLLLLFANVFMTIAWYGHLKFSDWKWLNKPSMFQLIVISWGIAFIEYCFQVPANRMGYELYGGPFNLVQLKIMQEVITLVVFSAFTLLVFKHETFRWNYAVAFICMILAVYFVFKK